MTDESIALFAGPGPGGGPGSGSDDEPLTGTRLAKKRPRSRVAFTSFGAIDVSSPQEENVAGQQRWRRWPGNHRFFFNGELVRRWCTGSVLYDVHMITAFDR